MDINYCLYLQTFKTIISCILIWLDEIVIFRNIWADILPPMILPFCIKQLLVEMFGQLKFVPSNQNVILLTKVFLSQTIVKIFIKLWVPLSV